LQQIDSAAEEDNGEEASQSTESTRGHGSTEQNIPGMDHGGRAISPGCCMGRHALFLPGILLDEIRSEFMKSVLFAFPEKVEIAKDG
jgi:hypothetical protein